uniref:Chemokine interleukin-8-like domain-containing protein n=1 Tax=Oncorhynchus tshawytscha TaxID=74940 RepID=A0A8C8D6X4_ONCTS
MSAQSDITVTLLSRNHCLLTGVFISLLTYSFPMNGCAACQKCRCIRTSSAFISPRLFHRIEILPPGAHCRQTEIIQRTSGWKVGVLERCLSYRLGI